MNQTTAVRDGEWRIREWFPELDEKVLTTLRAFHVELLHFNLRMNLISQKTEKNADLIHFADSIMASQVILNQTKFNTIHDIGSGNGFPGIVLAIMDPTKNVVLIDKDARKIEFLKHVVASLELKNVTAFHTRHEEIPKDSIECAVSRGLANVSQTVLKMRTKCKENAEYYHLKSGDWFREVSEIPPQLLSVWYPRLVADYFLPAEGIKRAVLVTIKVD